MYRQTASGPFRSKWAGEPRLRRARSPLPPTPPLWNSAGGGDDTNGDSRMFAGCVLNNSFTLSSLGLGLGLVGLRLNILQQRHVSVVKELLFSRGILTNLHNTAPSFPLAVCGWRVGIEQLTSHLKAFSFPLARDEVSADFLRHRNVDLILDHYRACGECTAPRRIGQDP